MARLVWGIDLLAAAALVALVLSGCGSSQPPAPPPTPPQLQPPAQPVAVPNPAPQQVAAAPKAKVHKKKTVDEDSTNPAPDPSVNPHDVFEIANQPPGFELADEGGQVSADAFTAVFLPKGVDSTLFERADSEGPKEAGKAPGRSPAKAGDDTKAEKVRSLPSGFTAVAGSGQSSLGWPLRIRCNRDGSEMGFVTGGATTIGHNGAPAASSPAISVVLDSFYMDLTEVTLSQYEHFRRAIREEKKRNIVPEPVNASSPATFPVLGVTLLQSQFYARWVGKELPTESEWERAARGEAAFDHPWGNGRPIWSHARSPDDIGSVMEFPTDRSPFGIYDLAGNAREWCVDRYSPTAFSDATKGAASQLRNWKGARTANPANFHVVKGNGPNWEAWHREGVNSSEHVENIGFRCVLRLSE